MTLVPIQSGLWWPGRFSHDPNAAVTSTLDLTGEKIVCIGYAYIEGRAASKTISGAGGGSIGFRTGALTWANGSTALSIGIQDVSVSAGPGPQPDGTFDVRADLTGGAGLTATAWNTIDMTADTKTISHGDLIAVVFDMTTRAGSDSFTVIHGDGTAAHGASSTGQIPGINTHDGSSWSTSVTSSAAPNIGITFDDGTLGIIDWCIPQVNNPGESYTVSSNPDERGTVFQVPFDCTIDAFWFSLGNNGTAAAADMEFALYSSHTSGTPTVVHGPLTGYGEHFGSGFVDRGWLVPLGEHVSLTKDTDYVLAMRVTGSSTVRRPAITLPAAGWRSFIPGGTTLGKVTREGGTGAFSATTDTIIYASAVRISQVHDGAGSSSSAKIIGG